MYENTIEFQTVVEDDMIKIPDEYRGRFTSLVTVCIFQDETKNNKIISRIKAKPFQLEDFSSLKLDLRNWKFDREEANER